VAILDSNPFFSATQIDSVPKGAVVFVSCPAKVPNAVYGGLMSMRAQASGAVGSIIDGRFRDLQEQRELQYPVSLSLSLSLSLSHFRLQLRATVLRGAWHGLW
jgi:regulator of RNase E activity RraA